jgi:hypothetical protein
MQGEFFLKINKRACTSIGHTRVMYRPRAAVTRKDRILSNISFVFWATEFQVKMHLRFTDLQGDFDSIVDM